MAFFSKTLDKLKGALRKTTEVLNTDVRTLAACVAGEKIQLGRNLTKGLGAGGDPDLGYQAVLARDYPVVLALFATSSFLTLVGILLADLALALVDPRISFGKSNA